VLYPKGENPTLGEQVEQMRRVSRKSANECRPYQTATGDAHIGKTFHQWAVISARARELKGRADDLRVELLALAVDHGEETSKGHRTVELAQQISLPNGETFSGFTREKRESRRVNIERTESLGMEKGLTNRLFRQEVITVLDEDELYACHQEGLITDEELESLIDTTTTHALKGW
jgi:hypothetical protein